VVLDLPVERDLRGHRPAEDIRAAIGDSRCRTFFHIGFSNDNRDVYFRSGIHSAPGAHRLGDPLFRASRVHGVPQLQRELGDHLNVFLSSRLARDPGRASGELVRSTCSAVHGLTDSDLESVARVLEEMQHLDGGRASGWAATLREVAPRVRVPLRQGWAFEHVRLKAELLALDHEDRNRDGLGLGGERARHGSRDEAAHRDDGDDDAGGLRARCPVPRVHRGPHDAGVVRALPVSLSRLRGESLGAGGAVEQERLGSGGRRGTRLPSSPCNGSPLGVQWAPQEHSMPFARKYQFTMRIPGAGGHLGDFDVESCEVAHHERGDGTIDYPISMVLAARRQAGGAEGDPRAARPRPHRRSPVSATPTSSVSAASRWRAWVGAATGSRHGEPAFGSTSNASCVGSSRMHGCAAGRQAMRSSAAYLEDYRRDITRKEPRARVLRSTASSL